MISLSFKGCFRTAIVIFSAANCFICSTSFFSFIHSFSSPSIFLVHLQSLPVALDVLREFCHGVKECLQKMELQSMTNRYNR